MKELRYTSQFKKELKRFLNQTKKLKALNDVLDMLRNEIPSQYTDTESQVLKRKKTLKISVFNRVVPLGLEPGTPCQYTDTESQVLKQKRQYPFGILPFDSVVPLGLEPRTP